MDAMVRKTFEGISELTGSCGKVGVRMISVGSFFATLRLRVKYSEGFGSC